MLPNQEYVAPLRPSRYARIGRPGPPLYRLSCTRSAFDVHAALRELHRPHSVDADARDPESQAYPLWNAWVAIGPRSSVSPPISYTTSVCSLWALGRAIPLLLARSPFSSLRGVTSPDILWIPSRRPTDQKSSRSRYSGPTRWHTARPRLVSGGTWRIGGGPVASGGFAGCILHMR